ncbi:MAG: hypothetical protein JRN10_02020 [Nitrososphaerota archaeon]|nr:hypothetical protein [Nitrososphaerota archaeon]MDG6926868.1 hypothetical protein [Nitrososphaerota archaeon]MDG6930014.1 hypothetical protein [Nitrososphaerota archaeon]MDG6931965.1 hypothetical protein [Nitrososphaerota archaeon]MDG6943832.1 hypothetical protein [Nitrososphaerota archaeon]
MKVIRSDKDAGVLLAELSSTFKRNDVVGLARLPEPRADQKYRDVLRKVYNLAGSVEPVVMVEFDNGDKTVYAFNVEADPKDGEHIGKAKVKVRGKLIKHSNGNSEITYYREIIMENAENGFKEINELADAYEEAYSKAFSKRRNEIDPYYWLS